MEHFFVPFSPECSTTVAALSRKRTAVAQGLHFFPPPNDECALASGAAEAFLPQRPPLASKERKSGSAASPYRKHSLPNIDCRHRLRMSEENIDSVANFLIYLRFLPIAFKELQRDVKRDPIKESNFTGFIFSSCHRFNSMVRFRLQSHFALPDISRVKLVFYVRIYLCSHF